MSVRGQLPLYDQPKIGESVLVTSFGDKQSLLIGDFRVHLDWIKCTGENGGARDIRVVIIGPKSVPILRITR